MARADCPECGGTGWKTVESPAAAGAGEAVREAVLCACTREGREDSLFERSRIPKHYRHCDFDSFETDLPHEGSEAESWNRSLKKAKVIVEGFAREFPGGREHGLLLMGPCGVGKTHLAVAALADLVKRGHAGLYYDYRELLKTIQSSYNPVSQTSEMDVLEPVVNAEVLLLDDVGSAKPSAWALDTVGYILNSRYNENRVTLLTTNYLDRDPAAPVRMPSGQALARVEDGLADRVGQRIRSRLYEMCRTIEMVASDYRREIRHAGRA
ncbi:MAG TPA: ATP-binding protein [Candidatus Acidoferrales bacterium]|nr:ATP-binding protein [Candidatus Acidoferrales bacterium]